MICPYGCGFEFPPGDTKEAAKKRLLLGMACHPIHTDRQVANLMNLAAAVKVACKNGCGQCEPYEGCNSTTCVSVEAALYKVLGDRGEQAN